MILKIIIFVMWLVIGLYILIRDEKVDKFSYFIVWILLMLELLENILLKIWR
jgi:hypothetical protein